jgi:hypothetical protein
MLILFYSNLKPSQKSYIVNSKYKVFILDLYNLKYVHSDLFNSVSRLGEISNNSSSRRSCILKNPKKTHHF